MRSMTGTLRISPSSTGRATNHCQVWVTLSHITVIMLAYVLAHCSGNTFSHQLLLLLLLMLLLFVPVPLEPLLYVLANMTSSTSYFTFDVLSRIFCEPRVRKGERVRERARRIHADVQFSHMLRVCASICLYLLASKYILQALFHCNGDYWLNEHTGFWNVRCRVDNVTGACLDIRGLY